MLFAPLFGVGGGANTGLFQSILPGAFSYPSSDNLLGKEGTPKPLHQNNTVSQTFLFNHS